MKKIIQLLTLVVILFNTTTMLAQADPGDDPDASGSGAPIDGGLTLLLTAGAIYGAKKVKDSRNK